MYHYYIRTWFGLGMHRTYKTCHKTGALRHMYANPNLELGNKNGSFSSFFFIPRMKANKNVRQPQKRWQLRPRDITKCGLINGPHNRFPVLSYITQRLAPFNHPAFENYKNTKRVNCTSHLISIHSYTH